MEFAEGNFGLIKGALEYYATTPRRRKTTIQYSSAQTSGEPINYKFDWLGEGAIIYYTTDGTTHVPDDCHASVALHQHDDDQVLQRPARGEVLTLSAPAPTPSSGSRRTSRATSRPSSRSGSWSRPTRRRRRRRHRAGDAGADARHAGGASARSRRASPKDYTAATTANVISTAGDATLSVADPSSTNTGPRW